MAHQNYASCIQACNDCADACDHCAAACLQENDVKMMARCIALDMDGAQICRLAASYMARGSEMAQRICALCADICERCGEECARHSMDHCQQCATACRPARRNAGPWRAARPRPPARPSPRKAVMYGDGSMMVGMGLWWLLSIVVIGLVAAAAIKYLFFHRTGRDPTRRNPDPGRDHAGPT